MLSSCPWNGALFYLLIPMGSLVGDLYASEPSNPMGVLCVCFSHGCLFCIVNASFAKASFFLKNIFGFRVVYIMD